MTVSLADKDRVARVVNRCYEKTSSVQSPSAFRESDCGKVTMRQEPINGKPEVTYPCEWEFKVIGTDQQRLSRAIGQIVGERDHRLSVSHHSRGGKYCSLRLVVTVTDEACRNALFEALCDHDAVTTVL